MARRRKNPSHDPRNTAAWDSLKKQHSRITGKIQDLAEEYSLVMAEAAALAPSSMRGEFTMRAATGERTREQWNAISDDFFALEYKLARIFGE